MLLNGERVGVTYTKQRWKQNLMFFTKILAPKMLYKIYTNKWETEFNVLQTLSNEKYKLMET